MPQKPLPFKIRDLRKKEKFSVDDAYVNGWAKYLKPAATAVYLSLCRHVDKEQQCFPATELIAREHGMTRRTVQEKTKLLEKCNIIKKVRIRQKNGKWLNTTYFLIDKSEWINPWEKTSHGSSMGKKQHSHGKLFPTKDTHKKVTHNNTITAEAVVNKNRRDVDNSSLPMERISNLVGIRGKKMLEGKKQGKGGAVYKWQDYASRRAKELGIKPTPSWFKFFKNGKPGLLESTFCAVVDANCKDPEKYFYKVYRIKEKRG